MTYNPTSFRIIWKIHKNNHLPRPYASECAGMRVGVEGAAKSLHLPRLHALQVTPAGVSVEGDFVLGWPDDRFVHCHPNLNSDCHRKLTGVTATLTGYPREEVPGQASTSSGPRGNASLRTRRVVSHRFPSAGIFCRISIPCDS